MTTARHGHWRGHGAGAGTRRTLAILLAASIVVVGCGDGDDDDAPTALASPVETPTPSPTDGPSDDATAGGGTASDDATASDDDAASPTDGASSVDVGELPGEPWEGFATDGDVLAVVGVAHDDVLNVREAPGTNAAIVARAAPTDDDLVATGRARQLSRSFWYEVDIDGATGWASVAFLAFLGGTDDATAELLGGMERPRAETMQQLGADVAALAASEEPPSRIVMSVAPTVGDLGEVTYDVVGLGDDSVRGVRLHVFGTPDEGGEGFVLRTVERTLMCDRGSDGELCV